MQDLSATVDRKFINSVSLQDLEIETDTGWQPISAIHLTVPYQVWTIKTASGFTLRAADTHIVFNERMEQVFVKDLVAGQSRIETAAGPDTVTEVVCTATEEQMYDITVEHASHRYYTNGILSHNTTVLNALSYALYGQALTNIKRDNLINKTNSKNMLVSLEFDVDNNQYKIERGRKPNVLRFFVNNTEMQADDNSQGDSKETQAAIEHLLGLSHDMFKHVLALNTYTEPFLSLRANDQRVIIEQLLGITLLSERAEKIKAQARDTKDLLVSEQLRINAVSEANKRIEEQIESLKKRQRLWLAKRDEDCSKLAVAIDSLSGIDVDAEIQAHRDLETFYHNKKLIDESNRWIRSIDADQAKLSQQVEKLQRELAALENNQCYACGQGLHDHKHSEIKETKEKALSEAAMQMLSNDTQRTEHLNEIDDLGELGVAPTVFYDSLEQALNHKNTLEGLQKDLDNRRNDVDPYCDQIAEMQNQALQTVSYDKINELTRLQEHQDFLLKLLTNKDSFVRKRIIEQNLSYLNNRLTNYLESIGLPHQVVFQNDLTVEITELGRDLDFDNLSRGERNRLILSMSWAFRDVWESLYRPINLLFIDELIDSGLDSQGVENSLSLLKKMQRERNKSIWLVSHRDELIGRVSNILKVIKENGFTSYSTDVDVM